MYVCVYVPGTTVAFFLADPITATALEHCPHLLRTVRRQCSRAFSVAAFAAVLAPRDQPALDRSIFLVEISEGSKPQDPLMIWKWFHWSAVQIRHRWSCPSHLFMFSCVCVFVRVCGKTGPNSQTLNSTPPPKKP